VTRPHAPEPSVADRYAVFVPELLARRPELADMVCPGVVVAIGIWETA